jgi:large subunit ribosomal protein L33
MARKGKAMLVRLCSTESGHFYIAQKNPRSGKKLQLKKYDPVVRKHVVFNEKKST